MDTILLDLFLVSVPSLLLLFFLRPSSQRTWTRSALGVTFLGLVQLAEHYFFLRGIAESSAMAAVNLGSSFLFPVSLAVLLYFFITWEPGHFFWLCFYLLCINLLIALLTCAMRVNDSGAMSNVWLLFSSRGSTRAIVEGTALVALDVWIMMNLCKIARRYVNSVFGLF